jgi:hypothetical protein
MSVALAPIRRSMAAKRGIALHKLPPDLASWYEKAWEERRRHEAEPRRTAPWFMYCAKDAWEIGCLAIAGAGKGDGEAAQSFNDAARFAECALEAPWPDGSAWSALDFTAAMPMILAFGSPQAAVRSAGITVSDTPGVLMLEDAFLTHEARCAWIRGDYAWAAMLCREVQAIPVGHAGLVGEARALHALTTGDVAAFRAGLDDVLRYDKRNATRFGATFSGIVNRTGMALCRMALTIGMDIDDQTYLPTRLLPREPIR